MMRIAWYEEDLHDLLRPNNILTDLVVYSTVTFLKEEIVSLG